MGSMIILIIAVTVLCFGLLYALLTYTFNPTITAFGDFVDKGIVTEETARMFALSLNMWDMVPFFMLIGLVVFCYERNKGTDLSAGLYFGYLALMIISVYVSVYLVFMFGLSVDSITQGLEGTMLTDVSAEWDTSGPRGVIIKFVYYFCLLLSFVTSILFMIHPILKQRETREIFGGMDRDDSQDFGDIELGQV